MTQRRIILPGGHAINVCDLGAGPTVVLIHGWSLSSEVWDRQIQALTGAGMRVVAIDQRGHGRSDAPLTGYGIEDLAGDVLGVLDELAIERAVIVGWSLGGMVGLRLAHDRPDRIRGLVMVASNGVAAARTANYPFGVPSDEPLRAILAAEHADRIALRYRAVGDPFKNPPPQHVWDWLHRISLQTPGWAGRAAMRTLLCTDQTDLLAGVTVPVTQIVGTADPTVSVRGAHWVRDRLDSTLIELDCGHYPMLEAADAFDRALVETAGRYCEQLAGTGAD